MKINFLFKSLKKFFKQQVLILVKKNQSLNSLISNIFFWRNKYKNFLNHLKTICEIQSMRSAIERNNTKYFFIFAKFFLFFQIFLQ